MGAKALIGPILNESLHRKKNYMLKKKLCSFVAQLVFSSFFEDGQLGSARLVKIQLELISSVYPQIRVSDLSTAPNSPCGTN